MRKIQEKLFAHAALVVTVATLVALFVGGCSKKTSQQAPPRQTTHEFRQTLLVPVHTTIKDLGAIELSRDTPTNFDLGAGRVLTITPAVLPDGNLQMDLKIVGKLTNGTIQTQQARILTKPGQQSAISIGGDLMVSLTPTIKTD